jgi:hypothetical protein
LGEWKARAEQTTEVNLIIGIEEGFTGKRYLERRLSQDFSPKKVHHILQSACWEAVQFANLKYFQRK